MTKHLRFLFVMLLAMIWSAGWAAVGDTYQKVTSESELSAGDIIVFASDSKNMAMAGYKTSKRAKYYEKVDVAISEGVFDYVEGLSEFKLGGQKGSWTFRNLNDDSYLLGGTKANLSNTKSIEANNKASLTFEKDNVKVEFGTSNLYLCLNSGANRFACYGAESDKIYFTQIYKLTKKDSRKDSEIAFSSKSYEAKITDKDNTYHSYVTLNNPNNLSVTYASSKTDVAVVNAAGEVKVLGLGTTTISATFAGDDTYASASAEYTLNVVDPNKTDVTFDFTDPSNFGYTESSSVKIVLNEGDKLTKDGFVLENVQAGKYTTRLHEGYLKIYASDKNHPAKGKISLSAPAGCVINRIVFTDNSSSPVSNLTFSIGEIDSNSKTWTGSAKTLTMEVAQTQVFIQTMTIYFVKDTETLTLNESATNTIKAKTGVNVTLNRPMNVGRWNTFCVPFSIDAKQIASQFGEGTQIAKFVDSIDDEIQFTTLTSNEIVAGEPYLVKPINAADSYSFTNVSIAATDPITKGGGEYISFKGIYNPTDITVGLPENTFAAGIVGNVVKKAVSGSNMKGFRAFFIIPGTGAQSSYMLKIDGTATSINSINGADVVVNAPVYNLQGQRVDGNNLTPGIYVKAGKKFVVK